MTPDHHKTICREKQKRDISLKQWCGILSWEGECEELIDAKDSTFDAILDAIKAFPLRPPQTFPKAKEWTRAEEEQGMQEEVDRLLDIELYEKAAGGPGPRW